MILHRFFPQLSRLAMRAYYRFEMAGPPVPARGPLLLVANHPNSLLDPACVCAVAGRPVRFLAKAPLFQDPLVGWLVRSAGAIPVYRRRDDPSLMSRNQEMFRAVHEALAAGEAVGLFPEGTSHSEPAMAPLRTGAARIALEAAVAVGGAFPIVPVGLVLREKDRFRSHALALAGEPVPWEDLQRAGAGSAEAVRELTSRIDAGLRDVTLNLERWEDAPVVECVEGIYAVEFDLPGRPEERVRRLRKISEGLSRLRRSEPERVGPLYRALSRYAGLLRTLELSPGELRGCGPSSRAARRWTLRQLLFFGLVAPLAALGAVVFFVPYRLTDLIPSRTGVEKDVTSSYKLLGGIVIYGAWTVLIATAVAWRAGPWLALAAVPLLLGLGLVTVATRDRWAQTRADARRYLLLRRRDRVRERLLERRRELARRLEALREEMARTPSAPATPAPPRYSPSPAASRPPGRTR
ncbi:MAG: lysophospholipid acyltransferase family protein [Gemmatimonadota bacterium]